MAQIVLVLVESGNSLVLSVKRLDNFVFLLLVELLDVRDADQNLLLPELPPPDKLENRVSRLDYSIFNRLKVDDHHHRARKLCDSIDQAYRLSAGLSLVVLEKAWHVCDLNLSCWRDPDRVKLGKLRSCRHPFSMDNALGIRNQVGNQGRLPSTGWADQQADRGRVYPTDDLVDRKEAL
eukprot:scaffold3403_cov300-Pinguiococcus_pyrenoidosus.AAC.7